MTVLTTRDIIEADPDEEGLEGIPWVQADEVAAALGSLRSSLAYAAPELQELHWQVFRERVFGA